MKRGEIYFANLNPTIGKEIKKIRPVLIVSNDANNKVSDTITVIPITSNTRKVFPFEVFLDKQHSGLEKNSKAKCHQIRTISKRRLIGKLRGKVDKKLMEKISQATKLHLNIF